MKQENPLGDFVMSVSKLSVLEHELSKIESKVLDSAFTPLKEDDYLTEDGKIKSPWSNPEETKRYFDLKGTIEKQLDETKNYLNRIKEDHSKLDYVDGISVGFPAKVSFNGYLKYVESMANSVTNKLVVMDEHVRKEWIKK